MLSCWNGDAQLRPSFKEIKAKLKEMLEVFDKEYGYVKIQDDASFKEQYAKIIKRV